MSARHDGRTPDQLRDVQIQTGFLDQADGSALICFGATRVLCTASVVEDVPGWMVGKGSGWLTAEYEMLPASTGQRRRRNRKGSVDGRTVEIQRLIGRSLRAICDFKAMGERTIWVDCDVLQADGGTRTASITGAWVALREALYRTAERGTEWPGEVIQQKVAAISVGLLGDKAVLDLDYVEDSGADVDMNIVMTEDGGLVEVQGTAEGAPFSREQLDNLLELGAGGIRQLFELQSISS